MHQEPDTLFGYRISDNNYGPTPPPEISAIGAPILTSDEYDNNRQFLDFFTTTGPEGLETLDSLQATSHDLLPNFHAVSTAFGHPEFLHYEHSSQASIPHVQDLTEFPLLGSTAFPISKADEANLFYGDHGSTTGFTSPDKIHGFDKTLYHHNGSHGIGPAHSFPEQQPLSNRSTELGFGSDSSFANHNYAPPPGTEDIEAVEGRILETLKSLEPSQSAANTQPSSPVISRKRRPLAEADPRRQDNNSMLRGTSHNLLHREEQTALPASETLEPLSSRKKARTSQKNQSSPPANHMQRRKSRTSEPKRQNLTEKEKKENHIKSEQKRRNQIREGFSNLLDLMPDGSTDGSSNSKCIVLAKAVDWLTELRDGNERLRRQLRLLSS